MKKQVFTLIELLVVISIIAILASLLLPAMKAARNKAAAITCNKNVKELGLSTHQYANDYNEYIPCSFANRDSNPTIKYLSFYDQLQPYYGCERTIERFPPFLCSLSSNDSNFFNRYASYGANIYVYFYASNTQFTDPYKFTAIRYPAQLAGIMDGYITINYAYPDATGCGARHSGGLNIAFMDGHADWRRDPIPFSKQLWLLKGEW